MNPEEEFTISCIDNSLMFLFYRQFPNTKEQDYNEWLNFWYSKKYEINHQTKLHDIRKQICDNKIQEILQKSR